MSKLASDKMLIQGLVTIKQGDKILAYQAPNSWVDAGLRGLVSALIGDWVRGSSGTYSPGEGAWAEKLNMYLGSDTATATVHGATALTTPIGNAPGTEPSTIAGDDLTNPSSGTFKTSITAEWYTGTVSGTVGELALYLKPWDDLNIGWRNVQHNNIPPDTMASRLSNADGDFSSFVIDTGLSLTVEWEIQAVFA